MHSKLLLHALQHFGVGKCPLQKNGVNSGPLQKNWSGQLFNPKFWHFWSGILCTPIFLEWTLSALQIFWSGLQVHSKNFGVDLRGTPKLLEWTLGALQIFEVNFECIIVYSKVVKNFGVERCPLQKNWSAHFSTPNWSAWSKVGSAFSLTQKETSYTNIHIESLRAEGTRYKVLKDLLKTLPNKSLRVCSGGCIANCLASRMRCFEWIQHCQFLVSL
jgi:hypothetical protein